MMIHSKRVLSFLVCALLVLMPVMGGANAEESAAPVTELDLYTYYADSAIVNVDAALEALKQIYPDLTINIEHRADSDGSTLKTRAAVGELPDMFECAIDTLVDTFVQSGDIIPLNKAAEATGFFGKYLDGTFDTKTSEDGQYYALQAEIPQGFLIYYNVDVFNELGLQPPKNHEEFKAVVQALSESGRIPLALFGAEQWPGMQLYDLAVIGGGEPRGMTGVVTGETKITDAAYVSAANKLVEMVSMGLVGKGALNTNASQAFELVSTGKAGMVGNGAWHFSTAMLEGNGENLGYFDYNAFADTGSEEAVRWNMSGGLADGKGYCVSANGDAPEFAAEVLLNFLLEENKASAANGSLSMLKEPPALKTPRPSHYQQFADSLKDFKSFTYYSWALPNPEILNAFGQATELLLTGTYSADQFIADLDEQILATLS